MLISEGILTFRTWAVWGRDTRIGILIWIVFFAFLAGSAVVDILAVKGVICTPRSFPNKMCLTSSPVSKFPIPTRFNFVGCVLTGGNTSMSISWTLLLAYDAWMVSWLGVRAIQICKLSCITVCLCCGHRLVFTDREGGQNALMITVFRDGIIYYIYLLREALLSCLDIVLLTVGFQCSR